MGAETKEFESLLTNWFGREACCVNTGTAALQLAIEACGVGRGDEVLVPSLTYVASYQAISATGAKPVSCDIYGESMTINVEDANRRLTNKTRAIMPVHYSGGVGNLEGVYDFASRNGLRVIEDAAHAFGTTVNEKRLGEFGDVVCFSFDGIKNITSGEGGCVVSSDQRIMDYVKEARLLGVERDTENRYASTRTWDFDVTRQGWRYHMSNIMAAIGIVQLSTFSVRAKKRSDLAKLYDNVLSGDSRVKLLRHNYDEVVPHIYPIQLAADKDRNAIRTRLSEQGIETGVHYLPNHFLTLYKDLEAESLPITETIYPTLISLPLHPDLSIDDVEYVCKSLDAILSE